MRHLRPIFWPTIIVIVIKQGLRDKTIGHFRVQKNLTFKARLSAKPLIWKWFLIMMQKNSFSQQRFRTYTPLEGEIFWNSKITMAGSQCHKPGQRVQRHTLSWLANTDVFPGETTTGNTSVFAGYCFRFPSHLSLLSARYWERTIRAQQGRWGATELHVKWPWHFTLIWGLLPVTVLPESRPAALGAIRWGILEFKVFQFIAHIAKTSRNYNLEGEGNSFLAAHRVCFYFRTIFPSPPRLNFLVSIGLLP